ncbi:AMP-binding protein [Streptomyces sp. M19]
MSQLRWLQAEFGLGRGARVLQKTPMSFDAAQWEILAPGCGGEVVMGAPGVYRDVERLIEAVVRYEVTMLQCVPTLLQALVGTEEFADCASLEWVFSGGEALSRSLAKQCVEVLPRCELVNLYGPTECTINASAFRVARDAVGDGPNSISIGSPVAGTEFHIVDDEWNPVGVGRSVSCISVVCSWRGGI